MNKHTSTGLANLVPLLLFAVLAVSVLTVLMTGAEQYGALTERDQVIHTQRTAIQYIHTKLRQAPDGVTVTDFDSCTTVSITENIEGFPCVTRIYCYDGYLRELFALAGEEMTPAAGEKIIEMEHMDVTMTDGLLTITLMDESGDTMTVVHYVEKGEVGS